MLGTMSSRLSGADLLVHDERWAEPHGFDIQVLVDRGEFLSQGDEMVAAPQEAPQEA